MAESQSGGDDGHRRRQRLEWLAAAFGIDAAYEDIWGRSHAVSDAGLRALLAELGVAAASDEDVDRGLALAHTRYWRRLAEPVQPLTLPANTLQVLLRLPRHGDDDRVGWRLELESGQTVEGDLPVEALALHERNEVDGAPYEARLLEIAAPTAGAVGPRRAIGAEGFAPGYHRLSLTAAGCDPALVRVIAAPPHCWEPPALGEGVRAWGWAVQLYGLRSARNWGVGDFGDLLALIDAAAARGASAVGLNPLHARFPHNPWHVSPYSPSSRVWLDVLAIDVEAVDDLLEADALRAELQSPPFAERLAALRASELVDFPGVSAVKHQVLGALYAHFRDRHLAADSARAGAFRRFQRDGGEALRRHALFEALQERFHAEDSSVWGWQVWPQAFRDPAGEAVAGFEAEAIERVEYFEYLQWLASEQLERAAARCRARGMAIGLYLDLAVSVDRAGSDCWTFGHCYAASASVGAPPDDFNLAGQDWGLPPLRPDALRECGLEPFVLALRANMRHAGALRIDHVMALMRLYWLPPGATARDGAYVRYPLEEMLAVVALESHRMQCLVVGEDLGTVPDALREALAARGVLSYRLLYFERSRGGEFKAPEAYPRNALVSIGTHDLPTLAGWWAGGDLQVRRELELFPDQATYQQQRRERAQDRVRLLRALQRVELLPAGTDVAATARGALTPALVDAVHRYLATTPARLMMVQPEDWLAVEEQSNLPGTVDTHPNWRRKLPVDVAALGEAAATVRLARVLSEARDTPRLDLAAPASARVPLSTYRVQLGRRFGFDDVVAIAPYLERLGIGDVYCSPVLRARAGSSHGYDIVDHAAINPELGGEPGFDRMEREVHGRGMGLLFDMVPNHMGVLGADNAWWMDVLEHGEASPFARYFDIDWHPANGDLDGKVLVPVLGDHYGHVLERGELQLRFEAETGSFAVRYWDHRLPLDPREAAPLLRRAEQRLSGSAATQTLRDECLSIAAGFANLPPRDAAQAERVAERLRDAGVQKRQLARLVAGNPSLGAALEAVVEGFNARTPGARNALHALLEAQAYRVAYWRVASDDINYRRFFDINELAALRMEDESVFEATHAFTLGLAAAGRIDGLRIDHPDGLYDPGEYFARLQRGYALRAGIVAREPGAPAAPSAQGASSAPIGPGAPASPDGANAPDAPDAPGHPERPLYVVIEKIAAGHERVPEHWAIHGTTGYRFAAVVNGLFVDVQARRRIDRIWRAFTGEQTDFASAAYEGRQLIMRNALASELTVLTAELARIARADRRTRDYTFNNLRRALAEVAACMPVYRTYLTERPSPQDRRFIQWAVGRAVRASRAADTTVFSFIGDVLLARAPAGAGPALRRQARGFARRFQQFTGPVTAKGVEDTALYRFNRLVSLNEVGSDPEGFGMSVRAFHAASADRAATWPHTMIATSTHDNKRSEDVRARIDVISEMASAWRLLLRRWRVMNRSRRRTVGGESVPSRNDEYLLYQVLLGSFRAQDGDGEALAAYTERMVQYMVKAAREAKLHTSWINPQPAYEDALAGFVQGLLAPSASNPFLADLREQGAPIAWFGALNSLSMVALKYTSPGVPDLYQGNECFDFSLVDPDNRRPVDFAHRGALLAMLEQRVRDDGLAATATALAAAPCEDAAKLFVTWRLLQLRRAHPALFRDGEYLPLEVSGRAAAHVVAFARRRAGSLVVVVAARLFVGLLGQPQRLPAGEDVWGDTRIEIQGLAPGGTLCDVLAGAMLTPTDGSLALQQVLASGLPAAVLVTQQSR